MDQLVSKHTGNSLDDLQRRAILGILQHQTYSDIAEGINYDEEYIGKISRELYGIVSQELKELGQEVDVKKSNFATSIKKLINLGNHYLLQNINHIHGNLYVNNTQNSPQDSNNTQNKVKSAYRDLTLAPKAIAFSNRETELQTLYNWIFNQNTPLISVLGLSGIGKTALVRRFIDLNLDSFEVIIWKNLELTPSLNQIITEILTTVETPEIQKISPVSQLLNLLNEKRCLIIIDDVQHIFTPGQFAGQYQAESKDYQKCFTTIAETEHQSNIILISQEKCAEMQCLDDRLYPVKALELLGLDDINILDKTGLNNQDSWLKLIQLYEGNPTYLKDIARLIQDVYDGDAADFLAETSLVITQNMQSCFNDLFNKLSPIEQQIILDFSKFDRPMSREELKENLALSSVDFVKGLQSLQYRYIVTKIKSDKILFKLSPVFSEYVRNYCQD